MYHNFGLEEIGIPGSADLRDALTNCSDPLKAIEEFQMENSILLPSLRPMLPLLDLHSLRRLDFYQSVLEELRDKLIDKITCIGQSARCDKSSKLLELLQKSFPVIKISNLTPVVMSILKYIDKIEPTYLEVQDKQLYNVCDTEVKRQIWEGNHSLFGNEVSPLFKQYIQEKEQILFDHENLNNLFFQPSPKTRRQGKVVQKLIHMIGKNLKLYDMVLQFLRTLFLRSKNVHYCTLRAELLMALHDMDIQEIISVDPCHKFTWCLDACIREKNVDIKRSRELQGFLDNIKKGQEQILGDLSMILGDPYAINFLSISCMKILTHIINQEIMPRDNTVLILLLRMLSLGLQAWEMINSQVFREPKLDPQVVTKFIPSLLCLMVDDQVRSLNSKLPPDERESAIAIIEHSGPPPDTYQAYIQENNVACTLSMYYTLQTGRSKDRIALMRVLGTLANSAHDQAFEDPFLHSLVAVLISMVDEFTAEDFCTVIFDEFFLTANNHDNVCHHLLKLLWYIWKQLPLSRLQSLLKVIESSCQQSPSLYSIFQFLNEKIDNQPKSPILISPNELDSPLHSVLTPSPL